MNEEGRFTEFYIWDPWDWDTNGVADAKGKMQYAEDPIAAIDRYLNGYYDYYDVAEAMRGSYYRAGDTYTFEYRDAAGNAGTITAVLPVDLAIPEGPDTEAPDVNVGIYAGVRGSYELIERYDNPEYDAAALESRLTARINDPAYGGQRVEKVLAR